MNAACYDVTLGREVPLLPRRRASDTVLVNIEMMRDAAEKLIERGFIVLDARAGAARPVIVIKHNQLLCESLAAAGWYKREKVGEHLVYTHAVLFRGCRVEWTCRSAGGLS